MNRNDIFPEVPEVVRHSVMNALNSLEEQEPKRWSAGKFSRIAATLVALIAVAGTTAVAAEWFRMNQRAEEYFNEPAEEVQSAAFEQGIIMEPTIPVTNQESITEPASSRAVEEPITEQPVSISDQGVTISVEQIVRDDNRLYMLLNVETQEAILDQNSSMLMMDFFMEDTKLFKNIGAQLLVSELEEKSSHAYFEIDAYKKQEESWPDTITLGLTELMYCTYENGEDWHKIEGAWNLEVPLGEETQAQTCQYEVNQRVVLSGVPVMVKNVEISAVSMEVVYDLGDINNLHRLVYDNKEEIYMNETSVTGIEYADGTTQEIEAMPVSGAHDEDANEAIYGFSLYNIIEPEEVSAILLGPDRVPVTLQ